jgi:hypothetical protein
MVEEVAALETPVHAPVECPGECDTLHFMHTTRAYFFGYFWFSSAPGGREI